ncbi:hypothetical protein OAF61_01265 [Pseudomonadales bacterium]|nr:hypothetical protein [Pseudomonadales bacterium]
MKKISIPPLSMLLFSLVASPSSAVFLMQRILTFLLLALFANASASAKPDISALKAL